MIAIPAAIDVPLRTDEDGVIRVGNTRVTLMTIVGRYNAGDTPEQIHSGFPTVPVADIYAVITYYLTHRDEVDEYIQQEETEGERLRRQFEELPSYQPLTREMLLARQKAKKRKQE